MTVCMLAKSFEISIHAPREGSDQHHDRSKFQRPAFLSTLPARGATHFSEVC